MNKKTRVFFVVDSTDEESKYRNNELFESLEDAEDYTVLRRIDKPRLRVAIVRNSYKDSDCRGWNYNDLSDTFEFIKTLDSSLVIMQTLTKIQQQALKEPCPACGTGKLREVEGDHTDEETGIKENYLWCDSCLLSMDGDGGYTN